MVLSALFYTPVSASKSLAAGWRFACVVKAGKALCWGYNGDGEVGDGTNVNRFSATPVLGFSNNVVSVDAGATHACAVTSAGGVKCWGANDSGQLGDGTTNPRSTASFATGLESGVQAVSAGYYHTCALTNAGAVLCWGYNGEGELGDGTTQTHFVPTPVSGLESGVKAISTGGRGTCALTTSGAVFCWGANTWGGVGDGVATTTPRTLATQVYGLTSGVTAIASGEHHSCALTDQGVILCWGDDYYYQLGDPAQVTRFAPVQVDGLSGPQTAITAGTYDTCSVSSAGAAYCWGFNIAGQLGTGLPFANGVPPSPVLHLSYPVTELAAGTLDTCALVTTGAVYCWGDNEVGELGNVSPHLHPNQMFPGLVQGLGSIQTTVWRRH
jgi:alpha-tubulin suppressor-like RCC1 family protein